MQFSIESSLEVLAATPSVLRAMLAGKSDDWAKSNYGDGTFSPFDVVGHLLHGEHVDWMVRARRILDTGDTRAFDPFVIEELPEYTAGRSMPDLLDAFVAARHQNLDELRAMQLDEAQLDLPGLHPALGPVTMRQLLATWTVHDLHHIAQICKAMAYQYRDAVGPWHAYLGILYR